jgi:hypothetical protein
MNDEWKILVMSLDVRRLVACRGMKGWMMSKKSTALEWASRE